MNNAIIVLDVLMGLMEVQAKWAELYQTAKTEGREITDAEIAALRAENKAKLAAFDEDQNKMKTMRQMAVKVDKQLIGEQRINKMFDNAAKYNKRKKLPPRKPMATLRGAQ